MLLSIKSSTTSACGDGQQGRPAHHSYPNPVKPTQTYLHAVLAISRRLLVRCLRCCIVAGSKCGAGLQAAAGINNPMSSELAHNCPLSSCCVCNQIARATQSKLTACSAPGLP